MQGETFNLFTVATLYYFIQMIYEYNFQNFKIQTMKNIFITQCKSLFHAYSAIGHIIYLPNRNFIHNNESIVLQFRLIIIQ